MTVPTTCFRLSLPEFQLIRQGLGLIQSHSRQLHLEKYDPELATYIRNIAGKLSTIQQRSAAKSHRIHLDALGIAVCMFAVRLYARECRVGQIPSMIWPRAISRTRLLRKLEVHRKRGKRKWLRLGDPTEYRERSRRWRRFAGWVRNDLRPIRLHLSNPYVRHLNWVCANVKQVLLAETNEKLPDDKQLRKLTRVMIRHVRRERACVLMKDLLTLTDSGRSFIASYMMKLIAKSSIPASPTSQPSVAVTQYMQTETL